MRGCALFIIFVVFFCFSQVLSDFDFEDDEDVPYVVHQVTVGGGNRRLLQNSPNCGALCTVRCGKHSRPNVCMRACGTCCMRCKCVPPGTHSNREVCGRCYTEMTTHGNKTKCP